MKKFLSFGVGYAGLDNEVTVVWNDGSASYLKINLVEVARCQALK